MEIQGVVKQILPLVTGQGKNGIWAKQEFIIETPGQYPKRIAMSLWGQENINKYDLETNMEVTAHINIESREHSGRWYTEVRAWKIESSAQPRSAPPQTSHVTSGDSFGTPGLGGPGDDLPF